MFGGPVLMSGGLMTTLLRSSRMSMALSIYRITPPMAKFYRVSQFAVALFGIMWVGLLIQKLVHCVSDRSWEKTFEPQCHNGLAIGVAELCSMLQTTLVLYQTSDIFVCTADLIADSLLVFLPIGLLWKLSASHNKYRLLMAIFSASILTTIVSIVHAVFLLGPAGILEGLTANVEVHSSFQYMLFRSNVFSSGNQGCSFCYCQQSRSCHHLPLPSRAA